MARNKKVTVAKIVEGVTFRGAGLETENSAAATVNEPKMTVTEFEIGGISVTDDGPIPWKPTYTRTRPTETGWYWHRLEGDHSNEPNFISEFPLFVKVRELPHGKIAYVLKSMFPQSWTEFPADGWWSGPIVAPEFKEV